MKPHDNKANKTLVAALVAVTLTPAWATQTLALNPMQKPRLISIPPKMAPVPGPLQGSAQIRKVRTVPVRRSKHAPVALGTSKADLLMQSAQDDKTKILAQTTKAASGLSMLAANTTRAFQAAKASPVGVPRVWEYSIKDAPPQFSLPLHKSELEECTCESQEAARAYEDCRYEEALETYKSLATKSVKVYGREGIMFASAMAWQGQCLHKLHREGEAKEMWRRSLNIYLERKPGAKTVQWLKDRLAED